MTLSFVDSVFKFDLNEIFLESLLPANAGFSPCANLLNYLKGTLVISKHWKDFKKLHLRNILEEKTLTPQILMILRNFQYWWEFLVSYEENMCKFLVSYKKYMYYIQCKLWFVPAIFL